MSIMKNKPIFSHYTGGQGLTAIISRSRISGYSRSCRKTAVRNGFLTGKRKTSTGMSVGISGFSSLSRKSKPSGFRHSPSFIRRGLGGGIQSSPAAGKGFLTSERLGPRVRCRVSRSFRKSELPRNTDLRREGNGFEIYIDFAPG